MIALDGTKRCIMPLESLQSISIGIDDFQCIVTLSIQSEVEGGFHVTFTSILRVSMNSVAGNHFVWTEHFIALLCLSQKGI